MSNLFIWAAVFVVIAGIILFASRLYFKKFGPNSD
jgi:hypothetical protein